jgi:DNA primase
MISDETIERVRDAADIVQIIGEHVNLKRTGADFRGPCPFHQGTHRNFSVSPKKGIYYCFVCHEGGDVFTFLQKRLGMEWPAAVRLVADRVGGGVFPRQALGRRRRQARARLPRAAPGLARDRRSLRARLRAARPGCDARASQRVRLR